MAQLLISSGPQEPLRRCLASRAATASPDHPVDSSELSRRILHGRTAAAGDGFPLSERLPGALPGSEPSAPAGSAAAEPADAVPWREGVTDHLLVASTSGNSSKPSSLAAGDIPSSSTSGSSDAGGSGLPRGRIHIRHGSDTQAAATPPSLPPRQGTSPPAPGPETQGAEVSLSLGDPVSDLTVNVSRWLEGSGAGLRHWLCAALHAHRAPGRDAGGGAAGITALPPSPQAAGTEVDAGTNDLTGHVGGGEEAPAAAATQAGTRRPHSASRLSEGAPPRSGQAAEAARRVDPDLDPESGPQPSFAAWRMEPAAELGRRPVCAGVGAGAGAGAGAESVGLGGGSAAAAAAAGGAATAAATAADEDEDVHDASSVGVLALEPFSDADEEAEHSLYDGTAVGQHVGPAPARERMTVNPGTSAGASRAPASVTSKAAAASVGAAMVAAETGCSNSQGSGLKPPTSLGAAAEVALWDGTEGLLPEWGPAERAPPPQTTQAQRADVLLAPPPVRRKASLAATGPTTAVSSSSGSGGDNRSSRSSSPSPAIRSVGSSSSGISSNGTSGVSGAATLGVDAAPECGCEPGPGSRSGSRSMPAELLTWELSHAADWRRVSVLVHLYGDQLDAIHVSAALVRLAKLHRRDAAALTVTAAAAAAAAAPAAADGGGASRVDAAATARAKARARARALVAMDPDREGWLTEAAERRLRRRMLQRHPGGVLTPHGPPPARGAADAGAAAQPRLLSGPAGAQPILHPDIARLIDSLLGRIPGLMPRAGYRTVSNLLWALGVLQPLLTSRRRAEGGGGGGVPRAAATGVVLAAKLRHFWQQACPQSLALALWGLARLGLRPGPVWVAEFEAASLRLLHRFNARELSCSLWALAAMRLRPDALWLAAARRSAVAALLASGDRGGAAAAAANLRSLATLLWAFAVLQVRLDGDAAAAVTAALTARLVSERDATGPQALSMAIWGLARLGLRPPAELLAAWRAAASGPRLAAAPSRAVACMLWSLARLRCAPPGDWVDEAAAALLARLREGRLGRQALCLSVGALAQLDVRVSPEWLRAFTAAAAPLVRRLDPSELGVVLHGTGRLVGGAAAATDVAVEFLAAADAAAAAALPAASADDLAGIGGGLTALGAARSAPLHWAVVRHASELVRQEKVAPRHAAACLEYLASSARPTARCPAAAAASTCSADAADGGDGAAAEDGTRVLCYDAVRARIPANTKQPLPPPQPPPPPTVAAPSRPPRPPRGFVAALLRVVLVAELDQHDVYDVGAALCAAAELGCVATTPAARAAVAAAATRVCGHAPGARPVLRLLQGMYGLRVRPRAGWLARVAGQVGGRLRNLSGEELELLLRLLGALQCRPRRAAAAAAQDSDAGSSGSSHGDERPHPSALTALLTAAQPALAAAPIQHLLQFATAIVAATTATLPDGAAAAAAAAAAAPPPPPATQLQLPPGWMAALEAATAAKLSQSCVSAAALVELLACFACLGHAPGAAWADAWYDSTARRLRGLSPAHLCTALHLQRRLGLRPPLTWLQSHATALMAAAAAPPPAGEEQQRRRPPQREAVQLSPLEVLAAVAELQRLGLDDASLAAGPWPAAAAPPAPLSSLVAAAATALHGELRVAEPAAQLATLAALQSVADPRVTGPSAPHAEGWAVGVVAMAHSVIAERPLHQLLAGLQPPPPAAAAPAAAAAASPEPIVALLASMARWGHAPDHRWLSGIARHVCQKAESAAAAAGGGGAAADDDDAGRWPAADAARAVCCLAALGYVPDAAVAERLQRLLQPSLALGSGGSGGGLPPPLAAELCCAWAAVRRRPPPAWWRAAEAGALAPRALAEVPPAALLRLPYSMAQLGHVPSYEWLACYLPHLTAALGAAANNTANANAASRAADLANLSWALGSAIHAGGYPPDVFSSSGALQALLAATRPLLAAMGPGQLVLLVEGLARGRHRLPQEWVDAFAGQVARQLSACGPSDLVSFLYCLAFLDARPPAPWLAAALHRTAQLLPPLLRSPEAYRADDLAWAVAKLDSRGAIAQPFLELLGRQRAAAAAAAAAAAPPPPSAWFIRAAAGGGGGGDQQDADAAADGFAAAAAARRGRRPRSDMGRRRGGSGGKAAAVAAEEVVGAAPQADDDDEEVAEARGTRATARRGRGRGGGVASGSRGGRAFRLSSVRGA
ncbi:hypothetical protein PLESTM_000892600 [Pleodorina starrii]|nr:hypothetical protein PLESTM_000892600 [Pleodorina starrii]